MVRYEFNMLGEVTCSVENVNIPNTAIEKKYDIYYTFLPLQKNTKGSLELLSLLGIVVPISSPWQRNTIVLTF